MPKCLNCHNEFKYRFRSSEKFCSTICRHKYYKNKDIEEKKQKNKSPRCLECGKLIVGRSRQYCCEECRYKAQLKRQQAERDKCKKPKAEEKPKDRPRKHNLTLGEINARARAEGLNYGQYVAKYGL